MSEALDWLLEKDADNPGVRYLTLAGLLGRSADDPDVIAARQTVMEQGPVHAVLAAQDPAGFWEQSGPGYYPKYRGTVWSMIYLAQLGADPADPRVRAGGEYLLANALDLEEFFLPERTLSTGTDRKAQDRSCGSFDQSSFNFRMALNINS